MTWITKHERTLFLVGMVFFGLSGYMMSLLPEAMFYEYGSILAVCFLAFPAFYGVIRVAGYRGFFAVIILGIFALTIESIGIHTGFPYSFFEYAQDFGYRLFESTPWTVFIAWSPLVLGAYYLATVKTNKPYKRFISYLVLLVALDMVLDPGAVARGLWSYTIDGIWYGVPLQNFFGWIFSGSIAYLLLDYLKISRVVQTTKKSTHMIAYSYLLSVSLWTVLSLGYGLYLPFVIGVVLIVYTLHLLSKENRKEQSHAK